MFMREIVLIFATRCSATVRNGGVVHANFSSYIYIYKYRSK
jgi:hypothetical protein